MKVIQQGHEIISLPSNLLETLEKAGRTCYKSEARINKDSAPKFVDMLIRNGHHAMIEFGDIIVKFVTNRGVSHELVRHRPCSFAQESTRYVKYGEVVYILPHWASSEHMLGDFPAYEDIKDLNSLFTKAEDIWMDKMWDDEVAYMALIDQGLKAQDARGVLPNDLKTEIVVKANIREWRHIFSLRCQKVAHPQMYQLMRPLLQELQWKLPVVFDDITYTE